MPCNSRAAGTLTFLVGDASEAGNMQCMVAQIADKGPGIANLDQHPERRASRGRPGIGLSRQPAHGRWILRQFHARQGYDRLAGNVSCRATSRA